MREDAAFEIAAEGSLDMGRRCFTVLASGEFQPSFEVGLDDAIPQRPLGTAALVARGSERYWQLKSISLPRLSDGRQLTLRKANDVTASRYAEAQRRIMEQQFQEAQKIESLAVLASGIAHEFNNLLSGILGATDLAYKKSDAASPIGKYLKLIKASSQRAATLCRQMLAYAGRGHIVPQPQDLTRLVEEMVDLLHLSVSRTATLELLLPPHLPPIQADKAQIQQVILNLVINASEALGDTPGRIIVAGQFDESSQQVCLTVSDTGPGISAETAARMFEPFYSTKFDGRGLGLAAARGIIKTHGGEIQVLSKPGEGAVLRLCFPSA
jgi:two-component system cell cycle sensor histidine kinase/response regulator CckA